MTERSDQADGIACPMCGCTGMGVYDTRPKAGSVQRRRECVACGHRVVTEERIVREPHGAPRTAGPRSNRARKLRDGILGAIDRLGGG